MMMMDPSSNHVGDTRAVSGGGATIVGLVIGAIVFLALLLVFGEALFSGNSSVVSDLKVTRETQAK
jgi:hypothetical protein